MLRMFYLDNNAKIDDSIKKCILSKKVKRAVLNLDDIEDLPCSIEKCIKDKYFFVDENDIIDFAVRLINLGKIECAEKLYNNFKEEVFKDLLDFDVFKSKVLRSKQINNLDNLQMKFSDIFMGERMLIDVIGDNRVKVSSASVDKKPNHVQRSCQDYCK